jgi:Holliday junction resolvasome RuvABC endonuclease subunit
LQNLLTVHLPYGPAIAVIEGYAMYGVGRVTELAEWGGIARLCLLDIGVTDLFTVPPQTLKKWVIGHAKPGKSGKDIVILKTFQRWGKSFEDSDLCDAFCLAKAGEAIISGSGDSAGTLKKATRESLSSV